MIERGRQEGRQEGQMMTIKGFLDHDVPWSTIEAATGIDEARFLSLKQNLEALDNGAHQTHLNRSAASWRPHDLHGNV